MNYERAESVLSIIVRPVIGLLIFIVMNVLLKMPVKNLSSEEHAWFLLIYRTFRYALSVFVLMGPYTWLFKKAKFLN